LNGIIGRKLGMTQVFGEDGALTPVTVIEAGPCPVVNVKTPERDGYSAVVLGFGEASMKRTTKPLLGIFKKAGVKPMKVLREFRVADINGVEVGQAVDVGLFKPGDEVRVTGKSKGRGFAGVVKRHGFHGGPKSHGQSDRWRAPGSLGQSSDPSRVFKGMRMAGHMGNARVTVKNLSVIEIDKERNLLIVKGAVPGAGNGYLFITKADD
jgi:large subunit ribosomal protein L3